MLPPNAQPFIQAYSLSLNVVHPGDTITGSVIASSNVASVELRVAGYSMNMTKTGVGHFTLALVVPQLPPVLYRTYPINIIARNSRGDRTERTASITVQ
jgi:hypothetical protein